MSSRPCNRCEFERAKATDRSGATWVVVPHPLVNPHGDHLGMPNGVDVFRVPVGEELNPDPEGPQWECWYGCLPERCAC